ncbi:MAG: hypothetical protein J3R72DRAFT_433888 [Linnemannia gamsii]|nr:MAG: hypothetical protein J3R72DRAFT_433888 [Linnemannia gamsii]
MESALKRFLESPELVTLLSNQLSARNIARLMLANKDMCARWTSSLYRRLDLTYGGNNNKPQLLTSIDAVLALGRNIHHVRGLKLGAVELAYLYNNVLELRFILGDSSTLPRWLVAPDPRTLQLIPLLPMVNLTRLHLYLDHKKGSQPCPYLLPSCHNPRATIIQASWFIRLNPHLSSLRLAGLVIMDQQDVRLLTWTIHELAGLKTLEVELLAKKEEWFGIGSTLFFSCPSTVRKLTIGIGEKPYPPRADDAIPDTSLTYILSNNAGDESWSTTPRRQEHLAQLVDLTLWDMDSAASELDIITVLWHCRDVEKLQLPRMTGRDRIDAVATFIAEHFSKLRRLYFVSAGSKSNDVLPYMIMGAMRGQLLEELSCHGSRHALELPLAATLFQRHSDTLRQLMFEGCGSVDSKSIMIILNECKALEDLSVQGSNTSCLRLTDAVSMDWASAKVIRLSLTIGFTDLQTLYQEQEPYYRRRQPLTLFAEETQQFELLERFYRQIGMLVQLQVLDLRVKHFHAHGHPINKPYSAASFPALLSVGDIRTDRPGYLRLLAGLTKLKELRGSVSANTDETKATMGWKEVVFMDEFFSNLRVTEFFSEGAPLRPPFQWLQEQRRDGYPPLSLTGRTGSYM